MPPAALVSYFALGGKSYYALPVVMFALACGAVSVDRWATPRRLRRVAIAFFALLVVMLRNYGEAGALVMFGKRAGSMPPVASGHVTFRFWRPDVQGRHALLVGFRRPVAATFCHDYRVLARVATPVDNEERGREIASCVLNGSLASVWPEVLTLYPG